MANKDSKEKEQQKNIRRWMERLRAWGWRLAIISSRRSIRALMIFMWLGVLVWLVQSQVLTPASKPVALPAGVLPDDVEIHKTVLDEILAAKVSRTRHQLRSFDQYASVLVIPVPTPSPPPSN